MSKCVRRTNKMKQLTHIISLSILILCAFAFPGITIQAQKNANP